MSAPAAPFPLSLFPSFSSPFPCAPLSFFPLFSADCPPSLFSIFLTYRQSAILFFSFFCPHLPQPHFFSFPACCSFPLPFYPLPSRTGRPPFSLSLNTRTCPPPFSPLPFPAHRLFSLSLFPRAAFFSPLPSLACLLLFLLSLKCPRRPPLFSSYFPARCLFSLSLEGRGGRASRVRVRTQKAPKSGLPL